MSPFKVLGLTRRASLLEVKRAYAQLLKVAGRKPQIVNNMGYSQLLRGNKKRARALLLEAKAGMADQTVVNANLALLDKG